MAFGRLGGEEGEDQPMADINMIPMIDVMLVLLIVFMITAPLLTNAVKLELPEASSAENQPKPDDISLALDAQGQSFWNGEPCDSGCLDEKMGQLADQQPQPELQLKVDKQVPYEQVARLMAQASRHDLTKLAFVSDPEGAH